MRKAWLLLVFSLLIPVAFAGGYLLATESAWDACISQVPPGPHGVPAACGDIWTTGAATGLFSGITGAIVWAVGWAIAWFASTRRAASSRTTT
jgi:hypothetical protein